MEMIKVLWLEDEVDKMESFFDVAYQQGIKLIHCKTSSDFERKLTDGTVYHAAILDALGLVESDDENKSLKALNIASKAIENMPSHQRFPYYILTAQLGKEEHQSVRDLIGEEKIFYKTNDEDKLFDLLKTDTSKSQRNIVYREYKEVLDLINKYSLDDDENTLEILVELKYANKRLKITNYFTPLRKILEIVFRKLNEYGILHDKCVQRNGSEVNLSESSLFLSGIPTKYLGVESERPIFPKIISENVKQFLYITGSASHTAEGNIEDKENVEQYLKLLNTPYLIYSLTFQLMDLIIWLDTYIKEHPNNLENQKYWKDSNNCSGNHIGIVAKDELGNYYCDEYLLNKKYIEDSNIELERQIEILEFIKNNDSRTKGLFPLYAKKFTLK